MLSFWFLVPFSVLCFSVLLGEGAGGGGLGLGLGVYYFIMEQNNHSPFWWSQFFDFFI
jgi:acetyl-CoA carboxylase alpha subunit